MKLFYRALLVLIFSHFLSDGGVAENASGRSKAVAVSKQWTPELSVKVKKLSDLFFSPDGRKLLYGIQTTDTVKNKYLCEYVISDLHGKNVQTLLKPSSHISNAQWSPDGRWVAFLSSQSGKNNLWIVPVAEGRATQITSTPQDILSFKWAPNSQAIAFVMAEPGDQAPGVEDPEIFSRNHLWMVPIDSKNTKRQKIIPLTAQQNFSVSDVGGNWAYDWSPDSRQIAFAYQERPGLESWTRAQLAVVDTQTHAVKQIATDNSFWKYFPKYSPDGQWLAFINAPGAFKWSFLWDIKVMSMKGGAPLSLARSTERAPILWQWASDSQSLYYVENERTTYSLYQMPLDGKPPRKILGSPEQMNLPGINTSLVSSAVHVNPENTKVAYVGQTYRHPPEIYIREFATSAPQKISHVNQEFEGIPLGKTELIQWRSLDQTPVEGLLTYPVNYIQDQRYPLIVQVHGGPNAADFNEYLPLIKFFATAVYGTHNYFVLRINYRGSLGYGQKFREDLIGHFGVLDYQDLITGVDFMIHQNPIDPDRVFVVGQSNGGTLTNEMVTQTDRFKAACSIAGETDYISLEGTSEYSQTSWYLGGSFVNNLQRFFERSPLFHVKAVKTPLLLQGGLLDQNVPYSQLEEFYRALKRVGATVQLRGYPDATHDFYPPKVYLTLLRACLEWIKTHDSRRE